ncbi:MAG: hypothetical protein ABIQ88_07205 [Chitinophagaceae bacterium]
MTVKYLALYSCFALVACNGSNVNEKIQHASEKAGQAVSEVAKGVSKGVKSSYEINITKTDSNALKAVDIGKIILKSKDGTDNMLSIYFIFNKDFSRKILLKAYDNKGLEMGRSSQLVKGKKEEARFIDFIFDKRTNIDNDSKITIE